MDPSKFKPVKEGPFESEQVPCIKYRFLIVKIGPWVIMVG